MFRLYILSVLVWYDGLSRLMEGTLVYDHYFVCLGECGMQLCDIMLYVVTIIDDFSYILCFISFTYLQMWLLQNGNNIIRVGSMPTVVVIALAFPTSYQVLISIKNLSTRLYYCSAAGISSILT